MSDNDVDSGIIAGMKANLKIYGSAYVKLALYMAIAGLSDILSRLGSLTPDKVNAMHWWDWVVVYGSPLLVSLFVWRTFVDNSMATAKANADAASDNSAISTKPTTPTDNE